MIKIENIEVVGWEAVIRGMRNPMNSWEKSDSKWAHIAPAQREGHICVSCFNNSEYWIGPNDLKLMTRLRNAGTDHRKFMRMIVVYCDITAPLYWWKEFDTYKVGTVANSCSTMHKIADKEFTLEDFSHEHLDTVRGLTMYAPQEYHFSSLDLLKLQIDVLNQWRTRYLNALKTETETDLHTKDIWRQMIQLLPSSYNQKRTVMLNYEVIANMYKSRKSHKLDEWVELMTYFKENLPYSELFTGE